MKTPRLLLGAILACAIQGFAQEPTPKTTDPAGPMWDVAALATAPTTYPAEPIRAEGRKAIFFDGLPYHGKPRPPPGCQPCR